MRKALIIFIMSLYSLYVFSQQISCEKTYGNGVNSTQVNAITKFKDTILLSGPKNVSGSFDIYFLKVKPDCDTSWTKIGVNVPNGDQDIETFNDGTFLFYGTINGISGNPGDNYDLILEKRNANGDTLWRKRIGYGANQEIATRMLKLSDENFLLAGNTDGYLGSSAMLLIKSDSEGIEQWRKKWDWQYTDYVMDVIASSDGNFVLAGYSQDETTGTVYTRFIKVNQSGDSIMSKQVIISHDSSYNEKMRFTYSKLSNTSDKGFLYTATLDSNSTNYDFIAKVDSNFNLKWKYIDEVPLNIFSKAYELADSSTVVLVTRGSSPYSNQYWLYKFDKTGQKIATLTFTSTACSQVRVTEMEYIGDSTFFVAGACLSDGKAYVAKLDKIGEASLVTGTEAPVSVKEQQWEVMVSPNPFSQYTVFKNIASISNSYTLNLISAISQSVYEYNFSAKEFQLSKSNLSSGLYFYIITDDKGNVRRGKVMVE